MNSIKYIPVVVGSHLWVGHTFRLGFSRHLHLVAFITRIWLLHFYLFKMEGSLHLIIWILIKKMFKAYLTIYFFLWKLQLRCFFHKDTNATSLNYLTVSFFYHIHAHLLKAILTTEVNCSDYHSSSVTLLLSSNTHVCFWTVGETKHTSEIKFVMTKIIKTVKMSLF